MSKRERKRFPLFELSWKNVGTACCIALATALSAAASLLVGQIIDEVVAGDVGVHALVLLGVYLALALVSAFASFYLGTWLVFKRDMRMQVDACEKTVNTILALSERAFREHDTGYYLNLALNASMMYGDIKMSISVLLPGSVLALVILLAVAVSISPWLALLFVVYFAVYFLLIDRPTAIAGRTQGELIPAQEGWLEAGRSVIEDKLAINAYFGEAVYERRFEETTGAYRAKLRKFRFFETLVDTIPSAFSIAMQVISIAVALALYSFGQISLGTVVAAYALSSVLQQPMASICQVKGSYGANRANIDLLRGLAASAAEPSGFEGRVREQGAAVELGPCALSAEPGAEPLFRVEGRIEVPKGALAVVKGPNGSGKSTLLDWLRGLCDPAQLEGEASVDASVARAAYLARPVPVVAGGLAENMLGAEADPAAAGALGAGALGGRALSGERDLSLGERQRLGLLRAFSSGAGALLLDEPLQNLDGAYRERALALVRAERGRRTVVAVMHSGELDADADLVLEIRDGRLVRTK